MADLFRISGPVLTVSGTRRVILDASLGVGAGSSGRKPCLVIEEAVVGDSTGDVLF
jgi:hypothetical protein